MKDFVAIDFETANHNPSSVCSVGIVVVRDGKIVDKRYELIRPEPLQFFWRNTEIHGLTEADVAASDKFPDVWQRLAPLIGNLPLVAHFSQFDEGCLKAAFAAYGMQYPGYKFHCTCRAARKLLGAAVPNHRLDTVAAYCGFNLQNHHNAIADAEACAAIAMQLL